MVAVSLEAKSQPRAIVICKFNYDFGNGFFGLGLDAVIGAILGHVCVSVLVVVAVAVFCRSLLPLVVVF